MLRALKCLQASGEPAQKCQEVMGSLLSSRSLLQLLVLGASIVARRQACPALETAVKRAGFSKAQQGRNLGNGEVGVEQIVFRQLQADVIAQLLIAEVLLF